MTLWKVWNCPTTSDPDPASHAEEWGLRFSAPTAAEDFGGLRLEPQQRHVEETRAQLESLRGDFSAELAKAREAVDTANGRADGAERRALVESDLERQARSKAENQAEGLRSQLTQAREHTLTQADIATRLQAKLDAAVQTNERLTAIVEQSTLEVQTLRARLTEAQQAALLHRTEAATVRELVERLPPAAVPPPSQPAASKSTRSAKQASSA